MKLLAATRAVVWPPSYRVVGGGHGEREVPVVPPPAAVRRAFLLPSYIWRRLNVM